MSPQTILVLISLVERAVSAATALKAVTDMVQKAQAEGREISLEDLKVFSLKDDSAREVLVAAIEAAEKTTPQ